jgi:hypothetical protein
MFVVVNFDARDQFSWINVARDTIFRGVDVEPKIARANHLHDKHARETLERQRVDDAATTFFQGSDAAFSNWDVFFPGAFVQSYVHASECPTEWFKLSVSLDHFKEEAALDIDRLDFGNSCQHSVGFGIFEPSDGTKLNGTTHGDEERHFVDFHDVNTKNDLSVVFHNGGRNRHQAARSYLCGCCANGLAFEGPMFGPEYVFGIVNVLSSDIAIEDASFAG